MEEVRGRLAVLRFNGERCIHARHCVLEQPHVFKANVQGPWIDPDGASIEGLVAVAQSCPSGAITYERLDGGPDETAPLVNTVRVRENGPLAVRAALSVRGVPAGFRATLCRCGQSKKKPYCDGAHADAGFTASGEPATATSTVLAARDGTLEVTPLKNGPLLVTGNLEILSGTGRTIHRVQKTALCRCGHSKNKPYCDGSHNGAGFEAE